MASSDSHYLIEDVLRALQEHSDVSAYGEASFAAQRLEDMATRPVTPALVREYLQLAALLQPHLACLAEFEVCTTAALAAAASLGELNLLVAAAIVRSRHCVAIGDFVTALECLLVPERGPSRADLPPSLAAQVCHERGFVLFELNAYREAVRFYEEGIALDPRAPVDAVVMRAAAVLISDGTGAGAPLLAEAVDAADVEVGLIRPRVQARFWSGVSAAIQMDKDLSFRRAQEIRELAKGSLWEDRALCLADAVEGVQIAITSEPLHGYAKLMAVRQRARSLWPRLMEPLVALKLAIGTSPSEWLRRQYFEQIESDRLEAESYQAIARGANQTDGASLSSFERTEALLADRLERQFAGVISSLWESSINAEAREDDSGEHPLRVGRLARLLSEKLGKGAAFCRDIEKAAGWHDIGKIAVPDGIVLRRSRLSVHDRIAMQDHTLLGAQLLAEQLVDHPAIKMAVFVSRSHHEHFDGNGYPDRLAGVDIPEPARITALAEAYDAMTHKRAWRPALTIEEALAVITAERGRQFDPIFADAFIKMMRELALAHADSLDEFLACGSHSSPTLAIRRALRRRTPS